MIAKGAEIKKIIKGIPEKKFKNHSSNSSEIGMITPTAPQKNGIKTHNKQIIANGLYQKL